MENILFGHNTDQDDSSDDAFETNSIHLIDFGFAEKFLNDKGVHRPQESNVEFRGNIIFSSLSKLEFKTCSRKDDLISLCFLMSYISNNGQLSNIEDNDNYSLNEVYELNKFVKAENSVEDFC